MVDIYDPDDDDIVEEEPELALDRDAAPEPVGVYERPENTGGFPISLIAAIVIIVLLAVLAYFLFLV